MNLGKNYIFLFLVCIAGMLFSCSKEQGELLVAEPPPPPGICDTMVVKFSTHIQPIIQAKCLNLGCHGTGYASGDLQVYAGVKVKVDNGSLNDRLLVKKDMPPPAAAVKLSDTELQQVKCWIEKGALNN